VKTFVIFNLYDEEQQDELIGFSDIDDDKNLEILLSHSNTVDSGYGIILFDREKGEPDVEWANECFNTPDD
jgi:hypothetical protein